MRCELCGVDPSYNFHHFIPQTLHGNKWFKKRYTKREMGEGAMSCKECPTTIHSLIPKAKHLGRHFNTKEKLLAHPMFRRYIEWKQRRSWK